MSASGSDDTAELPALSTADRVRPGVASVRVTADLGGHSDPGRVRPNNEDHFLVGRFGRYLETVHTNLPAGAVPTRAEEAGYALVVADGLGGTAAGEEASRLAIATLVDLFLRTPDWILRLDGDELPAEVVRRTTERYEQVNEALAAGAREVPGRAGFGTTLTLACSVGRELFVAHLGDSRAYLLRRGRLERLTRDHTVVQALVDDRVIDPAAAATHRLRHVLTRSLGDHGRRAQPDVTRRELEDGDRLLLCTDGLTEMLPDAAIGELLAAGGSAKAACEQLVARAVEAGGRDNVTAAVACYRLG